jgi:hypothetical protein
LTMCKIEDARLSSRQFVDSLQLEVVHHSIKRHEAAERVRADGVRNLVHVADLVVKFGLELLGNASKSFGDIAAPGWASIMDLPLGRSLLLTTGDCSGSGKAWRGIRRDPGLRSDILSFW